MIVSAFLILFYIYFIVADLANITYDGNDIEVFQGRLGDLVIVCSNQQKNWTEIFNTQTCR